MRRTSTSGPQENIPLVDDAFIKICDMVSDVSMKIRRKACAIMGSYRNVSEPILMQTFSKEIMSNLRRRIGRSPASKNLLIPTPEGDFDVESDDFRLLDSGACGAFVRGLEDEYQDVRNAAIDSIHELCMYNQNFSEMARDFLVDMFHDEIDSVRLNAINSLSKIGTHSKIILDSEQLQNMLSVLEDSNSCVREAMHGMLKVVRLSDADLVGKLVEALMSNMGKYKEDQLSIFRCFVEFGKNHGDHLGLYIPRFFSLVQNFTPKEFHADDLAHIGRLILVFNASIANPAILKMLPKYHFRHYIYLRDKFPFCFPEIEIPQDLPKTSKLKPTKFIEHGFEEGEILDPSEDIQIVDIQEFIKNTLSMIVAMKSVYETGNLNGAMLLIQSCSRDLKYISSMNRSMSGKGEFAIMYLECLEVLIEIKKNHNRRHFAASIANLPAHLLALSYAMENLFLGVSKGSKNFVISLRIIANLVWLIGALRPTGSQTALPFSTDILLKMTMERMIKIQIKLEGDNSIMKNISDLNSELHEVSKRPTSENIAPLFSHINDFTNLDVDLENVLKRSGAIIVHATTNSNKEFTAGFPLRVFIEADVFNIVDTSSIGIQVTMPDKTVQHFWPPSSHFIIKSPFQYQMKTHVEISHSPWTEECFVSLTVIKSFKPDLMDLDSYIMSQASKTLYNDIVNHLITSDTLILSKEPYKILIWPKL